VSTVLRRVFTPTQTRLSYAARVQPQPWLPVQLLESRITQEVMSNLTAVKKQAEKQWAVCAGGEAPYTPAQYDEMQQSALLGSFSDTFTD
jgi:hypothetical protein